MPQAQNVYGLTNDDIRRAAPAVFAEVPHERVSSLYRQIPTIRVIEALRDNGLIPTTVIQSASRTKGREGHAMHLTRVRRREDLGTEKPDVREAVIVNAHDGTRSYLMYAGIFRMVCGNGMVMGDIDTTLRIPHRGHDTIDNVVEGTLRVIEESASVMDEVDAMKAITLSREEQLLLSELALSLRFDVNEQPQQQHPTKDKEDVRDGSREIATVYAYKPSDLLVPRRQSDRHKTDLYSTYNIIQEHLTKGAVSYDGRGHRHKARAITGISQDVKMNQLLWRLAQEMKALKLAN